MAGILLLPLWVCAQGVNFRPAFLYGSDRTCCEREQDGFH